jgi:hypothetical protein
MPGQETHHLTAHLRVRHVRVQVDPVQALHVQTHMTVEQIVDRYGLPHQDTLPQDHHSRQPHHLGGQRRSRIRCTVVTMKTDRWLARPLLRAASLVSDSSGR